MTLLLTPQDLDKVFDDPAFMEERFDNVQQLLLDGAEACTYTTRLPLPGQSAQLTVQLRGPGVHGYCLEIRHESRGDVRPGAELDLLFAVDDGALLGLASASTLNGWRLAVPSGLAARYLAPPLPRILGILGTDEQAWPCLRVLTRALPSLSQVRVVGADAARTRTFAAAAARRTGLIVTAEDDPREVAAEAEVVAVTDGNLAVHVDRLRAGALLINHGAGRVPTRTADSRPVTLTVTRPGAATYIPLTDIISGRVAARFKSQDTVLYQAGEVTGWDSQLVTSCLWQAWQMDVGTRFQVERCDMR